MINKQTSEKVLIVECLSKKTVQNCFRQNVVKFMPGCPQLLEILEISRNLIGPPGKLQNVGGNAVIHAVLVSWLDGTVMSVGRSSSSHTQLEIVHTLLVVVILLIKL